MTRKSKQQADELDEALIGEIGQALKPIPPDARARARMHHELLLHAGAGETEVIRAEAGHWREFLPGIKIKTLRLDRQRRTQTSLWHLEPGSHIPAHSHTQEEECLVLEGSVIHRGETYREGDFLYARSGVKHDPFYTDSGALLLIRSELVPRTNKLTRFLFRLFSG